MPPTEKKPAVRHNPATVYGFALAYGLAHHGRFPTIREITKGCNLGSTNTTHNLLNRLLGQGLLGRDDGHWFIRGSRWLTPAQAAAHPPAIVEERVQWHRSVH